MTARDGVARPGPSRRALLASAAAAAVSPALAGTASSVHPVRSTVPASASASGRGRRRPNIVLILADDLGWNELGCFGQRLIRTPNLDRLAVEGVRYTDFHAAAAVCAPARCSLLTGMHTGRGTVRNNPQPGQGDEPLAEDEVTIAHVLGSVGYRTALFGKWGFSPDEPGHHSHPNAQGFDEFFGYLTHVHAHSYYPTYLWQDQERVELPENAAGGRGAYAPDLFAQRCLDYVEAHRDEPFFLFWSTNIPHAPQEVPDVAPYADTGWTPGAKAHAAQITRMDGDIGRLVTRLNELGVADDTVIFFCGDNGPHEEGAPALDPDFFDANGPFRGYKRNLLEGGIRVPALLWAPGLRAGAGTDGPTVSDHPWAMWDLLPTFAGLAGAPVPPYVDGASAAATITGDPVEPPDHQYWWRLEPYTTARAGAAEGGRVRQAAEAVRRDRWKAIRYAPGTSRDVPDDQWTVELYDLAADPAETVDLAARHPDVADELVAVMREAWTPAPLDRVTWDPSGAALYAPRHADAGQQVPVTATFTNHTSLPAVRVRMDLAVPDGWTIGAVGARTAPVVRPGESFTVSYTVLTAEAADPVRTIQARTTFRRGGTSGTATIERRITVQSPPPVGSTYLSDLPWVSAANGWGPVERDRSNGRAGAGDGPPIALAGRVFEKGLGVHAPSEVVFFLGGVCDRFTADVGIDDFSADQSANGRVVFQVWADDLRVYDSGLLTAATGPRTVDVALVGARLLRLVVTDGGNGNTHDHSSWAGAAVHRSTGTKLKATV